MPCSIGLSISVAACLLSGAFPCSEQDADEGKVNAPDARRTLALEGLVGVTNSGFASQLFGARTQLSFPWQRWFGLGAAGMIQEQYSSEYVGAVYSGGVVFNDGSPVTSGIWGLALEVGMAGGSRKLSAPSAKGDPHPKSPDAFLSPYAEARVILQVPLWKSTRPYAALSGRHTVDEFGESVQTAMLSLGLAFDPF
jgi:hypothetical protein